MADIIKRLRIFRKEIGLSQADFANKLGLARASYCMIETGKDTLSDRNIMLICRTFNVNENWLRHGQGDIFSQPSTPQDEDESRLLAMFRKLSKEMKQLVLRKINQILALDSDWSATPASNSYQSEDFPEDLQKRA